MILHVPDLICASWMLLHRLAGGKTVAKRVRHAQIPLPDSCMIDLTSHNFTPAAGPCTPRAVDIQQDSLQVDNLSLYFSFQSFCAPAGQVPASSAKTL